MAFADFKKKLKNLKWSHYIAYVAIVVFTVICIFSDPKRTDLYLFEKIGIAIILSVSLSFVVGFLGELSLGHAGFMCIGAYLGGKISSLLVGSMGNGLPALIISVVAGGVCAALAGLIIGLPALRLKGDYLAIVTLAFGQIVMIIFQNSDKATFGGAFGLDTPRYDYKSLYVVIFVIAIITIAAFQNTIRSKHGRAITAIRDNEIAAKATGVPVTRYKLFTFIMSAFFAGVAGVLYSYTQTKVQSVHFDYNYSIEILVMVVLGGMGSLNGSIAAAALITFLNEKLSTVLTGNLAVLQKIFYSLVLIFIIIYSNAPAFKNFREKYNLGKLKSLFKRKHDPGYISDDEGRWDRVPTKIKMDEILSVDLTPDTSENGDPDGIGGERNE